MPAVIVCAGLLWFRRGAYFDAFLAGATGGARTTFSLLPVMVSLCVVLSMFNASGAMELIADFLAPVCEKIGLPAEILPLAVTRPVSGSAASASFAALIEREGVDSLPALAAAILMGSSDTLVYVICVYFGKTRVKHAARAFVISGTSALLCLFLSSFLARAFFT